MTPGASSYGSWFRCFVIVLANVTLFWLQVGCGSAALPLMAVDSSAFQDLLHRERTGDAARAAYGMEQRIRGHSNDRSLLLDPDQLPEPYAERLEPSMFAEEHHLGYAADRLIAAYYMAKYPNRRVLTREPIVDVSDALDGDHGLVNTYEHERRIDLVDLNERMVFEIVPPGQSRVQAGQAKLEHLLGLLNPSLPKEQGVRPGTGYAGEIGVRFAENAPPWKLSWSMEAPGIIAYHWFVLAADKHDERAYREAYALQRWREPTPREMQRFARALHEVVQRLVLAREEMGQTRAATEMPMLPGQTDADYLRTILPWSAKDEAIARLLPVMREPPAVRLDPRFIAAPPDGGLPGTTPAPKMHPGATTQDGPVFPPHPSAPVPYTLPGHPGNMPWHFFMGYSAHHAIAYNYEAKHPVGKVYKNHISCSTIVDKSGGNPQALHWTEADLRPDIAHYIDANKEQFVYEIKPQGPVHLAKGKEKLAQYITVLNVGMIGTSKQFGPGPEFHGEMWITFKSGTRVWRIKWQTTAPGILQYQWQRPDLDESKIDPTQIVVESFRGLAEGRARAVSEADMKADAADLFDDLEGMLQRRELLKQFRDGLTLPIEGVGVVMETILATDLSRIAERRPQVLPILRKIVQSAKPAAKALPPAPLPKAMPRVNAKPLGPDAPESTPRVNAPSLGSDTAGKGSARPTTPGKTPAKQPTPN